MEVLITCSVAGAVQQVDGSRRTGPLCKKKIMWHAIEYLVEVSKWTLKINWFQQRGIVCVCVACSFLVPTTTIFFSSPQPNLVPPPQLGGVKSSST